MFLSSAQIPAQKVAYIKNGDLINNVNLPLQKLRLPPHVDPLSMDVPTYTEYVRKRNHISHERSVALLDAIGTEKLAQEIIGTTSVHLALAVNGSDGRGENCASPLEPMLFVREAISGEIVHEVRQQLNDLLASVGGYVFIGHGDVEMDQYAHKPFILKDVYYPIVEVKVLAEGNVACYRDQDNFPRDTWPSRIIDVAAISLHAEELITEAKSQLCQEILSPSGKKMLDNERNRVRDYASICRPGENQGAQIRRGERLVHFDLKAGFANYTRNTDDKIPDLRSFKYGPLRLVQHILITQLLRAMRTRTDDALRLIKEVPRHTTNKMAFLQGEGVLKRPNTESERMASLYLYFLRLYHLSEFHYVITGEKQASVEIPDSEEAAENLQELLALVDALRGKS